jgi:hypothetical protein
MRERVVMGQYRSDSYSRKIVGRLADQIPLAKPLGHTVIRCRCGKKHRILSSVLLSEGLACKCGYRVEGRGDIVKKMGQKIMRRYSAGHDR